MKSTGEVLGLGKTMQEALFKGLTSAGMVVVPAPGRPPRRVRERGRRTTIGEIVSLAKKLDDLHFAALRHRGDRRRHRAPRHRRRDRRRHPRERPRLRPARERLHRLHRLHRRAQGRDHGRLHRPAPPRAAARHPVLHLARHGQRPGGHHRQPLQRAQHRARGHQPHAHRAPEPEVCENAGHRRRLYLRREL